MEDYSAQETRAKVVVEEMLMKLIPLITQANSWAEALHRPMRFEAKIVTAYAEMKKLISEEGAKKVHDMTFFKNLVLIRVVTRPPSYLNDCSTLV